MSRIKGRPDFRAFRHGRHFPAPESNTLNGRTKLIGLVLGSWLALEILAFAIVLRAIGLLPAIALGLGTTALGLSDVKRLLAVWRDRGKLRADGGMLDGALQALASLLLVLPGFASDVAGLALKSPSVRAELLTRVRNRSKRTDKGSGKGGEKSGGPQTIDLAPHEWKHLTPSGRPRRKRKKADGLSTPSSPAR
jgi:UPF0716 protein FxsA